MSHTTPLDNTAAADHSYYTNLHLSAVPTLYPPSPRNFHVRCGEEPPRKAPEQQTKLIRTFYTEPNHLSYNRGSYLIKETRYAIRQEWHAASDELVADDAAPGSAVIAVGWWVDSEDRRGFEEIWETRLYYVDKDGMIRERINRSYFQPKPKEDFDTELPKPEELILPSPGWKQTPLASGESDTKSLKSAFPRITPSPATKLAAIRSEIGEITVFYQNADARIHALTFNPERGWKQEDEEVIGLDTAKLGTPLTAVAGAWSEIRLFYVTPEDLLREVYGDDHTGWTKTNMPMYKLHNRTAMFSAVAWNYASAFFQIRIYATLGSNVTLSAVAAVIVENECNPKVYFYPRKIIAEWDVCKEAIFPSGVAGIVRTGEKSAVKRKIEEETRAKIQEEEMKRGEKNKAEEARQLESQRNEEAMDLTEEDKKYKLALTQTKVGETLKIENPAVLEKMRKKSQCSRGYKWKKVNNGWTCEGGSHSLTDEEFAALY
ncbi:hypothetical protein F4677DRAFT_442548 [Hypoxylon crocopeplum]|nr:hypothetical protein F4677DRAFT_442548 [Hypoxylon crocopeplum]